MPNPFGLSLACPEPVEGSKPCPAALGNVVVGERAAVLAAAARAAQGWDFAAALHHALSHGCEDFCTLDADLVKTAARATTGGATVTPVVTKL